MADFFKINKQEYIQTGTTMHKMIGELYPFCRSITGDGVRETLNYIKNQLPELIIREVPSGTKAFDWVVPDEWQIRKAYIEDDSGQRIVDFQNNNLHVMGYSEPVDRRMNLEELDEFLYSLPKQPKAIPYITSYYKRRWGFCLTHEQRLSLKKGNYHVFIDSDIKPGVLNYGELILPGATDKEVLLSTYVCHPSMANNELSGPVVTVAIAQWLMSLENLRFTYRIIFIPETIGSIVYLSKHLDHLKRNVIAGFNITCIGDERCYSFLPSRNGRTLSDRVALHVLKHTDPDFKMYTWLDRGSDERQYCAPGVDLPIATVMRSKYGEYPEYHTSLDDLSLVTPAGLEGGFTVLKRSIDIIETDYYLQSSVICEPQLGKRGLYPTLSTKEYGKNVKVMTNFLSYCDGKHSLLEIAKLIGEPFWEIIPIANRLINEKLLYRHNYDIALKQKF
jgi:aminopeptidase-like protein